jgi:antitoxin component YwqK of YwqJK toxin-antitoxin module
MKYIICLSLLFFLYSVVSTAQDQEVVKDGYQIFKYPNGAISSEGIIKNGKPEGLWKSYYVTGVKKSEGKRRNFLLDSVWVFFDQTGDTIEKFNYLYGKKNGYYYKYKKEPSRGVYVWSKELFAGDKKEGTAYIYFPDGKVQQTIAYNNGKKQGLSKEYDKEGNIITLLEYSNDFLVSRERINRTDNKGLKQGEWKEFYPNGRIKTERTFKDDLMNGYFKQYDLTGKLILTMLYENGSIVNSKVDDQADIQIVNRHDQDGKLIYSGPYRNNIPVGVHREYNKDGKISNALMYNDLGIKISEGIVDESGKFNGRWKDYFPNGNLQAEGQYTDSRRTGTWKFYNASQKLEQTGSYNNGRPDGLWKWFYDNGSVLREEEYFQGQRDGSWTEYSITGEIIAQGQYSDGERNGEWKFKTGDVTETGKYIIGLKDGVWKSYYPDGKLKFKGSFVQGNPDGSQTIYYQNGKVKEEQFYEMGIRERIWKKFDEEGLPSLVIAYKHDVEVSINGVRIKLPESDTKLIK